MAQAVLITGSNMGDVAVNMARVLTLISHRIGSIKALSSVFDSEPWGFDSTQMFMNQVVVVDAQFEPEDLLSVIHDIEREMGRTREDVVCDGEERVYSSRTMDIDILFYDNIVLDTPKLTIPHPMLQHREFVLRPLVQVMGQYVHPILKCRVAELWHEFLKE